MASGGRIAILSLVLLCLLLGIWQLRGAGSSAGSAQNPAAAILSAVGPTSESNRVEGRCWRTGPLDEGDARKLVNRLLASGIEAEVAVDIRREKVADWVYLPPLETQAAAQAELQRLRGMGIDDLAVVVIGPMRHGLSLGLYAEPGRALQRVAALKAIGVDARIEPRYLERRRTDVLVRSLRPPQTGLSWNSAVCR
jgi:hypothetical protein